MGFLFCVILMLKDMFGLIVMLFVVGLICKGRQVLIVNLVVIQMFDSQNVVVYVLGQEYQFFGDSQWFDCLLKFVQLKFVQVFQSFGKVGGVGLLGEGLVIDEQIQMMINIFEILVFEGVVVVDIIVCLFNDCNGQVCVLKNFWVVVLVFGFGNKVYIVVMNLVFGQVFVVLVVWVFVIM